MTPWWEASARCEDILRDAHVELLRIARRQSTSPEGLALIARALTRASSEITELRRGSA